MNYPITVQEFKTFFSKDFDYGVGTEQVSDTDITKAMTEAKINFNESMFDTIDEKQLLFYYLTAFYLVLDINNANSQGGSATIGLSTYKQVKNVAESFAIPKWVTDNPMFSIYAQNGYGIKYISLIYPYLIGNIGVAFGRTLP